MKKNKIMNTSYNDVTNIGISYATRTEQLLKSFKYNYKVLEKTTNFETKKELIISFDPSLPFFIDHSYIIDFEVFLTKNFPEVYKFLEYNKNEKNKGNLITFQFGVSASSFFDNTNIKFFKQSKIKQVRTIYDLLLLYNNYMDLLFAYRNYDYVLKELLLIIGHSNNIKFK